jgi:hypothetical protein
VTASAAPPNSPAAPPQSTLPPAPANRAFINVAPQSAQPQDQKRPAGVRRPARSREVNSPALAAFFLGLVGVAPLAIASAYVAFGQIRVAGERGRGLAMAGVGLAATWVLGFLVSLIFFGSPTAADPGEATQARVFQAGECVLGAGAEQPYGQVPCETPHAGEVFGVFSAIGGDAYPGEAGIIEQAETECARLYRGYMSPEAVGGLGLKLTYFYPSQQRWAKDRTITCLAMSPGAELQGSISKAG